MLFSSTISTRNSAVVDAIGVVLRADTVEGRIVCVIELNNEDVWIRRVVEIDGKDLFTVEDDGEADVGVTAGVGSVFVRIPVGAGFGSDVTEDCDGDGVDCSIVGTVGVRVETD